MADNHRKRRTRPAADQSSPGTSGPGGRVPPKAAGGLPGLGHVVALLRDPLGFVSSLDTGAPVTRLRFGPRTVYAVSSPRLVHEMLVAQANQFTRGLIFEKARAILGDGLLTSDGEKHLAHRRMMQPLFLTGPIARYVPVIAEVARARVATWRPSQVLDVHREMHHLSFEVILAVLIRSPLPAGDAAALLDAFPGMIQGILAHAMYPWTFLEKMPTRLNRRMRASAGTFRRIVGGIIETRRDHHTEEADLLGQLLTAPSPHTGEVLGPVEVYDELITMMIAGSETVGLTLAWALHELGNRPDLTDRVLAELDDVVGDGAITADAVSRLDHMRRVVQEVLRLHTPNWIFMRTPTRNTELGGYRLPGGCDVMFSPTAIHRSGHFYPDPLRFDPDRWLPERVADLPRYAYLPFGAGKTKCIGEPLAMAEMAVILATILRRYRLSPQPGSHVREVAWATVQPRGLDMVVTPGPAPSARPPAAGGPGAANWP